MAFEELPSQGELELNPFHSLVLLTRRSPLMQLLWGISFGLLPLGARVAYAILSSWSSEDLFGARPSANPVLAKSNPITGDWVLFLLLSSVMEYVVVAIYLFSSVVLSRRRR
jgi:hypothetical protein